MGDHWWIEVLRDPGGGTIDKKDIVIHGTLTDAAQAVAQMICQITNRPAVQIRIDANADVHEWSVVGVDGDSYKIYLHPALTEEEMVQRGLLKTPEPPVEYTPEFQKVWGGLIKKYYDD